MELENQNTISLRRSDRSSNIELLRIVCMLLLIAHHSIVHGGALSIENCTNKWIGLLFVPVGKICFDAFVAISAWYTVDSKFKASRFFRIWFQILFYNIVFTGLTALLGNGYAQPITWRTWLGACFPIIGNSHGFAASYVVYYLCTPFLRYVAERLTQRRAALLVGILFLTQVFSSILGSVIFYTQPMTSEILLFVLAYFTAFYLKRWPIKLENNMLALGLIVLFCWFGLVGIWVGNALYPDSRFFAVTVGLSGNELSLNHIIAGFALFLFAKNIKMPKMPRLNLLASTTFGILLFHDHNYFRPVVWGRLIQSGSWLNVPPLSFAVHILASVIVLFVLGAVIDFMRQKFVEAPLMRSNMLKSLCDRLDGIIQQKLPNDVDELTGVHSTCENQVVLPSAEKAFDRNVNTAPVLETDRIIKNQYSRWFSISVLVCVALYWVICIIMQGGNIDAYFVADHHNTGMDYFNMLANLSHDDPWYANANYPAMCFLILRPFFRMLPASLRANEVDGFALREEMIAQLGYFLFILASLFVVWELLQHFIKGARREKILFAASLLFSGPMFFLLERGNLLLLSLAALLGYLALYNSPKKSMRYVGYVCLAFSASIKIYPAIFGLLVPMKKRWKETLHLVAIGAAAFLIPFFCFDGFDSLLAMFRGFGAAANISLGRGAGHNFSFRGLLTLMTAAMGYHNEVWPVWVLLIPLVISIWIIVVGDQEWKKLFGMTLLCIWLPDFSYTYTLVLFFLPLISFFGREQKASRFNTLYTALFVLLVIPYMVPMLPRIDAVTGVAQLPASWASIIINYVTAFFALSLLLEHYVDVAESSAPLLSIKKTARKIRDFNWTPVLLLGIVLLILTILFPYVLTGNVYFLMRSVQGSDLIRANLPTYYQLYDTLASGGAFWSWRMGIGTSMFSHADVYFDPFTYILFLAGRAHIPDMFIWMFAAKLFCEGMSMYGYLRSFRLGRSASVLSAVLYAFCGYSLIMGSNFALGTILVYIPLAFWATEKWLNGGYPWPLLGMLFLTAIYSYYFFYQTGIILCVYIIIRTIQKKKSVFKYLGVLAALGVAAVLLAAPVLFPQLELTLSTARVSGTSDVTPDMLWLPQLPALATALIRMIGNDWLGCTITDTYRGYVGDYFQYSCYFCMLFYVLFWYYIRTEKKDRKSVLLVSAFLALAALLPVASYVFNGFSTINARWMFIVPVLQCLVIAKCLSKMAAGVSVRIGVLLEGMAVTIGILLGGFAALSLSSENFVSGFLDYVVQAKAPFLAFGIISMSALILALVYNRANYTHHSKKRGVRWVVLGVVVLIAVCDVRFNYIRWFGVDTSNYYAKTEPIYDDESQDIIRSIQDSDKSFYRIYKNFDSVYDSAGIPSENDAMAQGYYGLKCYNSVNNPEYVEFLQKSGIYVCIPLDIEYYKANGISPQDIAGQTLNYIDGVENDFLLMDYLGVKYYLAQDSTANVDSGYTHLFAAQGIEVYQNNHAYPLAFVNKNVMPLTQFERLSNEEKRQALMEYTILNSDSPDVEGGVSLTEEELASSVAEKSNAFELISFSNDKVVFSIHVDEESAYLSTTIPYDDDWHIYIDGKETKSEKINISLLGAKITHGTHEVTLQYSPKLFYMGIVISMIVAASLLIFAYADYRKK